MWSEMPLGEPPPRSRIRDALMTQPLCLYSRMQAVLRDLIHGEEMVPCLVTGIVLDTRAVGALLPSVLGPCPVSS
jgi:hypothetical protein